MYIEIEIFLFKENHQMYFQHKTLAIKFNQYIQFKRKLL